MDTTNNGGDWLESAARMYAVRIIIGLVMIWLLGLVGCGEPPPVGEKTAGNPCASSPLDCGNDAPCCQLIDGHPNSYGMCMPVPAKPNCAP